MGRWIPRTAPPRQTDSRRPSFPGAGFSNPSQIRYRFLAVRDDCVDASEAARVNHVANDPLAGMASLAPFLISICFRVGAAALSYSLAAQSHEDSPTPSPHLADWAR
jgi:hypothetical protein